MRVLVAASTQSKITTSNALYFLKPFYQSVNTKTTLELKIILSSLSPFLKFSQIYKMEDSDNIEDVSCCNDLVNLFFSAGGFDDYEVRRLAFIGISEIIPELCEEFRKKVFDLIIQNIKSKEDIRTRFANLYMTT